MVSNERRQPEADRGYTLIELMVVLGLLMVLTTMALPQFKHSVVYAREAVLREDLFRMRDAIDQYYADKGQWPATLDSLVGAGYILRMPVDPFTRSAESWQAIPAEPDPNNLMATPGVYDVRSGSDQTSLDGTKYANWD